MRKKKSENHPSNVFKRVVVHTTKNKVLSHLREIALLISQKLQPSSASDILRDVSVLCHTKSKPTQPLNYKKIRLELEVDYLAFNNNNSN